jgi:hypothetical protein
VLKQYKCSVWCSKVVFSQHNTTVFFVKFLTSFRNHFALIDCPVTLPESVYSGTQLRAEKSNKAEHFFCELILIF